MSVHTIREFEFPAPQGRERRTRARRPDLYARFSLSPEEEKTLRRYCRREGLPWPEEEESER